MSSELESLYQQIILDHAKRRIGEPLIDAAVDTGAGTGRSHQYNPLCGDEITLQVSMRGETLENVSWDGTGCAISMASASVLTELVTGQQREDVVQLVDRFRELMRSRGAGGEPDEELGDAAAFAGVSRYPARVKCAMLSWVALEEAVLAASC